MPAGAIEAPAVAFVLHEWIDFQCLLVRLRLEMSGMTKRVFWNFQCLLVRLRPRVLAERTASLSFFQCLLVRLRLERRGDACQVARTFNACWCD